MRHPAAASLACLLAAAPAAAWAQASVLPNAATLNPRGELVENVTRGPDRARRSETMRPPHGRVCFNQAEARDAVVVRRLVDPVRALRMGRQQGDALSARLCRWMPDEFVYEVSVLRHDGRVLWMFMNAQNGEAVVGQALGQAAGQAAGIGAAAGGQGSRPFDKEH